MIIIKSLRRERNELKLAIIDLQCRSMKNNLIFTGLAENGNENAEDVLRDFIYEELGIDHNIHFGNVHRFGKRWHGKPRPIVARFIVYKELVLVKDHAYRLKNRPYGISEQFPTSIEERRKKLYPVAKHFRQAGRKTRMVRDKLFVDGKLYDEANCGTRDSRSYNDVTKAPPNPHKMPPNQPADHERKPASKRQRASSTPTTEKTRSYIPGDDAVGGNAV